MKAYKTIDKNNRSAFGGSFNWSNYLPGDTPGKWAPRVDGITMCESGYHSFFANHSLVWLSDQCFEVELGDIILFDRYNQGKAVSNTIRIVRKLPGYNKLNMRRFCLKAAEMCIDTSANRKQFYIWYKKLEEYVELDTPGNIKEFILEIGIPKSEFINFRTPLYKLADNMLSFVLYPDVPIATWQVALSLMKATRLKSWEVTKMFNEMVGIE